MLLTISANFDVLWAQFGHKVNKDIGGRWNSLSTPYTLLIIRALWIITKIKDPQE